jgi:hypothetical protein
MKGLEELRPHSFSAAPTGEPEPSEVSPPHLPNDLSDEQQATSPETVPALEKEETDPALEREARVGSASHAFWGAVDSGTEPMEAYVVALKSVYSPEIPEFRTRLNEEALGRGMAIEFDDDAIQAEIERANAAPEKSSPIAPAATEPLPKREQKHDVAPAREALRSRIAALAMDTATAESFEKEVAGAASPDEIARISRRLRTLENGTAATPPHTSSETSGIRDTYREDAYDTQGHEHEELLERLDRRNGRRYDPKIDAPKQAPREEEHKRMRQGLIDQLDPAGFTIAELHSDNYTGGPNQGTENTYSHPEAPGFVFTQTEVDAKRQPREAPAAPPTGGDGGAGGGSAEGDSGREEPTAGQVIEVTEVVPLPDWSTRRPEFMGLVPKPLHDLLHGTAYDQHHFAMLVGSFYPQADAVMKKSITGERLPADEGRMLEYARHEYARRTSRLDFVRTYLKPSDLEIAARRDPEFARVLGLNGSKRTAEVFKREIAEISMQRTELLDRLYNACTNLKHHRASKRYKEWEKDVHDLSREAGTDAASFDKAFDMRTAESRRESRDALTKRYHQARGPFMRIVDKLVPLSHMRAGRMMRKAAAVNSKIVRSYFSPQSRDVSAVNNELAELTEMLRFTVSAKPDVVEMLEREALQNISTARAIEGGPTTVGAARTESRRAPRSVDNEISAHIRNFQTPDSRGWDHATRSERQQSMDGLRADIRRRQNAGGQGWFARALSAIFRSIFNSKAEEAINRRPAMA